MKLHWFQSPEAGVDGRIPISAKVNHIAVTRCARHSWQYHRGFCDDRYDDAALRFPSASARPVRAKVEPSVVAPWRALVVPDSTELVQPSLDGPKARERPSSDRTECFCSCRWCRSAARVRCPRENCCGGAAAPATPDTAGLISADEIARMRPNAFVDQHRPRRSRRKNRGCDARCVRTREPGRASRPFSADIAPVKVARGAIGQQL